MELKQNAVSPLPPAFIALAADVFGVDARELRPDTTYGGWQTYPIPDGDIVPNNRNYKYSYEAAKYKTYY